MSARSITRGGPFPLAGGPTPAKPRAGWGSPQVPGRRWPATHQPQGHVHAIRPGLALRLPRCVDPVDAALYARPPLPRSACGRVALPARGRERARHDPPPHPPHPRRRPGRGLRRRAARRSLSIVSALNLLAPPTSPFHVPTHFVVLFGKWLTYALLAVSLDLVGGYCGILSLGHGAFFALGGYAMGMYLMRQIGPRGVYAHPVLPDFMESLNWKELPVAGRCSPTPFPLRVAYGVPRAGRPRLRARLVRLPGAGDGRLSLDHHADHDLRPAARFLPQQFRLRRQQRGQPTSRTSSASTSRRRGRARRCSRSRRWRSPAAS